MSNLRQQRFRFRLPWQSETASSQPVNESSGHRRSLTDETQSSAPPADTVPTVQSQIAFKPPSPSHVAPRSGDAPKRSSATDAASRSRDASTPLAFRSRIASMAPSPSQTSSRDKGIPQQASQPRAKAPSRKVDSQPSRAAPAPQSFSMTRSSSQADSRQRRPKQTSLIQSPPHLSSKSTEKLRSQQHIASPAATEFQPTNGIVSPPTNKLLKSRPKSREGQSSSKSLKSSKSNLKPEASPNQPQAKEKNTPEDFFNSHMSQYSPENSNHSEQTMEHVSEASLESEARSRESDERKEGNGDLIKETKTNGVAHDELRQTTTNVLQTDASKFRSRLIKTTSLSPPKNNSTTISSTNSSSSFEDDTDRYSLQEEIMEYISRVVEKLITGHSSEENAVSFIALMGDNKGASMHLAFSMAKAEGSLPINSEYKSNPNKSPETTRDSKGSSKQKMDKDSRIEELTPLRLYINTNAQGINNSVLVDSSFTERNPGVEMNFCCGPIKSEEKLGSSHAGKA